MLLEFDADQRLWQDTVRDAVGKQCPASLVREVAEDGVDPAPLWKTYVDAGWTELTDPENAVELAIVLEELGRATDPTPFLATLTQFAPLVGDRFDPQQAGAAVYDGVTAYRDADGWVLDGTAQHVLDGDRAERLAVVTDGGRLRRRRRRRSPHGAATCSTRSCTSPRSRSPACSVADTDRLARRRRAGASPRADRAWRSPWSARASASSTSCSSTSSSRQQFGVADRLVPGRPAQGRRHARRHRAGPRAVLLRGADHRRRRSAQAAGGGDGQGVGGRVPGAGVPARPADCSAPWDSPGRTTFSSRSSGPRPAS